MTLVTHTPNRVRSFNGMDHLINRFFEDNFKSDSKYDYVPAADIREDEKSYLINMDVPGLTKEDLNVSLDKNILTISGEKKSDNEESDRKYHLVERRYGSFKRSFRLPEDIDSGKISAKVENGILSITIDKAEEKLPKVIDINVK